MYGAYSAVFFYSVVALCRLNIDFVLKSVKKFFCQITKYSLAA